jgi:hypothetical protein
LRAQIHNLQPRSFVALDLHLHKLAGLVESHDQERVMGFATQSESAPAPSSRDRELQCEYLSSFLTFFHFALG